jgi:hypothetical protein
LFDYTINSKPKELYITGESPHNDRPADAALCTIPLTSAATAEAEPERATGALAGKFARCEADKAATADAEIATIPEAGKRSLEAEARSATFEIETEFIAEAGSLATCEAGRCAAADADKSASADAGIKLPI